MWINHIMVARDTDHQPKLLVDNDITVIEQPNIFNQIIPNWNYNSKYAETE